MKKREEILGVDHPHTLTSMANLALTYKKQGWTNEACELNEEVLKKIEKRVRELQRSRLGQSST